MALVKQSAKCPFCKETITAGASRCKHCHSDIKNASGKNAKAKRFNNFRVGFIGGVIFSLMIGLLIYTQFVAGK